MNTESVDLCQFVKTLASYTFSLLPSLSIFNSEKHINFFKEHCYTREEDLSVYFNLGKDDAK